jgi:hypothetical protein
MLASIGRSWPRTAVRTASGACNVTVHGADHASTFAGPRGSASFRACITTMAHLMDQATAWKVRRDLGGDNGVAVRMGANA